jgi:flagellar basal body-associated protein FliL
MEMFCPNCGTQNADGSAFCANCGAPLSAGIPPSQPTPPPPPPAGNTGYYAPQGYQQPTQTGYYPQPGYGQTTVMAPPKKSKNTVIGIIVVVGLVLVAALVLFLVFGLGGNPLLGSWTGDDGSGNEFTFTFNKNGTFTAENDYQNIEGKYKIHGNKCDLTDVSGSDTDNITVTFKTGKENGKQVLDMTFEGETLTLYKENTSVQNTPAQGGQSVVGKWEGTIDGSDVTITFKSNGTVVATNDGTDSQSKYKISGKNMTITDEDENVSSGTFKIYKDDGKTALDMTFNGDTMTLYKK